MKSHGMYVFSDRYIVNTNTKFHSFPGQTKNKMKRILFSESKDGVFDALQNCSDSAHISAFATIRKSVLYLCVTGNCKNICIISKCKDEMQSNEGKNKKPSGMQCSPSNISEYF